jgi:hypothetical protein
MCGKSNRKSRTGITRIFHLKKSKIMRRFPFFVAPLVGIVVLYFVLKLLFVVVFGAAVLGMGAMAFRGLRRHRHGQMRVAYLRQPQPTPIDAFRSEPAFSWAQPKGRVVEII